VEAHAGFIELLRKNRPGSIIAHCAAGEKDEDGVAFFANSRAAFLRWMLRKKNTSEITMEIF